jgi:hypothetical protein
VGRPVQALEGALRPRDRPQGPDDPARARAPVLAAAPIVAVAIEFQHPRRPERIGQEKERVAVVLLLALLCLVFMNCGSGF